MPRYYFASRYSRHPEMREHRAELLAAIPSAVVTSRWIDCHNDELEQSYTPEALNADPAGCWRHAEADLHDMDCADVLVSFDRGVAVEDLHRGRRQGWAARRVRLITSRPRSPATTRARKYVGPRENVVPRLRRVPGCRTARPWPDKLPLDPPNTTIGQAANGRWWAQCTRPGCTHYSSCLRTRDEARAVAAVHQLHHRRRGEHR